MPTMGPSTQFSSFICDAVWIMLFLPKVGFSVVQVPIDNFHIVVSVYASWIAMWRPIVAASFGVIGFVASVTAEEASQAEVTPPGSPSQMNWAGFYVGVNGGYGASVRVPALQADWPGVAIEVLAASSISGGLGGVQAGYNWQGLLDTGLVFGIEGDLDYEKMEGTLTAVGAGPIAARASLNSFGTLRGRVGYAWDRALFYATAGLAFGDIENTFLYKDSLGQTFSVDMQATKIGYAAGGGVGLSLTPNWSLKVEYEFLHLEGFSASGSAGEGANTVVRTTDFGHDYQIIKAGIEYHVGGNQQSLK